ncbi:uncharacterized protein LOC113850779 [Abrus precatorius]|uniref:Uncharacterized protein LOC113850779 n=1 Tax=Abrus precatorius TaxID=3816 RepID=A0A8B8K027_ABRPR|nr:uncharacterized protein LOC113850779 [Abrus precatorius]
MQYQGVAITTDEDIQQMFQIHNERRAPTPTIELYIVFKQITADTRAEGSDEEDEAYVSIVPNREIEWEQNSTESDDPDLDEDGDDEESEDEGVNEDSYLSSPMIGKHPFEEPSFMRALDLTSMQAPEFPKYANLGNYEVVGELCVGMQFNNRENVIRTIKHDSISKGVDYKVFESEPNTFYCKCVSYGIDCDWLVRASLRKNKCFWEIKKYNGPHTCMRARISQDHSKLDADTIAECIKPMVESDPSFKIKLVINEVQARFGYTTTYRKAWMAKQKAIEKPAAIAPCIRAFRHCKPLVQVDGTHLYEKYNGALLVAVAQDGNQNILPIGFAIVEGETADGWHFFLKNLRKHVVTQDGVGIISDRHESINAAIRRSNR